MNEIEEIIKKNISLKTIVYSKRELLSTLEEEEQPPVWTDNEYLEREYQGISVIDLDENAGFDKIDLSSAILLAGTKETLSKAKGTSMATIGFGSADDSCDIFVEGFEEVDVEFLDRIMKRKQNLPWIVGITQRTILREFTMADMDRLFELYDDEEVQKYMEPLFERKEEEEYERAYIDSMYRFYGYGFWLVISRETGEVIGRAGFGHASFTNKNNEEESVLEMGYLIDKKLRNQGYATEVCNMLIRYAKNNLEYDSLNCFIHPENEASASLCRKLGFKFDGEVNVKENKMNRFVLMLN